MSKYNVGDRVRIIASWELGDGSEASCGEMDHWLGQVMTIRMQLSDGCYKMDEDVCENHGDGWFWDDALIAGLADETASGQSFTKSDLRSGDIVTARNGRVYMVMLNTGVDGNDVILNLANHFGYMSLESYDENLLCRSGAGVDNEYDIMKCQRGATIITHAWMEGAELKTVFEREEIKRITFEEAEMILSEHFGITTKIERSVESDV